MSRPGVVPGDFVRVLAWTFYHSVGIKRNSIVFFIDTLSSLNKDADNVFELSDDGKK